MSNWIKRDTTAVSDDRLKEFVALCEDRIYTDLRVRAMEAHVNIILKKAVQVDTVSGADTVLLTPDTAATSYAIGDRYSFEVDSNNTTAVDVNVSSLGAKSVFTGEEGNEELVADDWTDGDTVEIVYDGTNFIWVPSGGYPLPLRYIEQRRIYMDADAGKKMDFFTPEQFWARRITLSEGQPKAYTIEGPHIIFAPRPNGTFFGKFLHFRRFAAFSSDSDTNWILTNASGIYLFGSLVEAHIFLGNQTTALAFAAIYQERIDSHNNVFKEGRFPRGRRATRSEVSVI